MKPDDIQRRLEKLAPRTSAVIGLRAAMRVLPVLAVRRERARSFAYWSKDQTSRHILTVFRAYQHSVFRNGLTEILSLAPVNNFGITMIGDANAEEYPYAYYAAEAAGCAYAAAEGAGAAYFAATAADNAATAAAGAYGRATTDDDTFRIALMIDMQAVEGGMDRRALLAAPLWPHRNPELMQDLWSELQRDLLSLHESFRIWVNWYQNRLNGQPLDMELERQLALLPDEVLSQEPAAINAYLTQIWLEHTHTPTPDNPDVFPPELPSEQEPGLQFASRDDGKIDLKRSGIALKDDLAEIAAMRGVMVEAADDLIAILEGSNAHGTISRVAQRYKDIISSSELSIDQLYAYGVRLENARDRINREAQTGDYPELAVAAGEAIDSVIALHGPTIYSTSRGRELIENARAFREEKIDVETFKPIAENVADAIYGAEETATENAREIIRETVHDIGEGPHPERSTQIGRTALSNFVIAAANGVHRACHPDTVGQSVEDGVKDGFKKLATGAILAAPAVAGAAVVKTCAVVVPSLWGFFLANSPLLHQLSGVAGAELSWLPSFLHWVEAKRAKLNF